MSFEIFDVIVLGGGIVGLSSANLLAKCGLSVALIETKPPILEWDEQQYDFRCSAISRSSQKIFQQIGIWDEIIANRISPYRQMVVWDKEGFGEITFDAKEVAEPDLGHIIENRVMIKTLWTQALKNPNIKIISPAIAKTFQSEKDYVVIVLEDQRHLKAKLVIGADGSQSWTRQAAGIKVTQKDYHQSALVATVQTESPHQETAWQRFLPDGPLAFLPLTPPNTSSIVWTSSSEKATELMDLDEEQFCKALAHAFDYRLGKVLGAKKRKSFALLSLHAKQYVVDRVVIMGDAAHVIHPLAGQGVNLGLNDAITLSEILSKAQQGDYDIGHYLVLRKYERARKGNVFSTMAAMTFLKNLFGSTNSNISILRSMALNCVNQSQFLKKKIISEAMGIGG